MQHTFTVFRSHTNVYMRKFLEDSFMVIKVTRIRTPAVRRDASRIGHVCEFDS